MKSLLYPAVALMNRLSFGMKFSLISVLFLLPMLATNYYLVRDSWREYQGTRVELQSLDLLGSSLALRRVSGECAYAVDTNVESTGKSSVEICLSIGKTVQHAAHAMKILKHRPKIIERLAHMKTHRQIVVRR